MHDRGGIIIEWENQSSFSPWLICPGKIRQNMKKKMKTGSHLTIYTK